MTSLSTLSVLIALILCLELMLHSSQGSSKLWSLVMIRSTRLTVHLLSTIEVQITTLASHLPHLEVNEAKFSEHLESKVH